MESGTIKIFSKKKAWGYVGFLATLAVSGFGISRLLDVRTRQETRTRNASRAALRVQQLANEVEFFMNRRTRAVQNYVLLGDEAEKLQNQQGAHELDIRMATWRDWSIRGEASGEDLAELTSVHRRFAKLETDIFTLMSDGRRTDAMRKVQTDFIAGVRASEESLRTVKARVAQAVALADQDVLEEVRLSRWLLGGGMAGATVLGALVFVLIEFIGSVGAVRISTPPPLVPPPPPVLPPPPPPQPEVRAVPPPPSTVAPPPRRALEEAVEDFREILIGLGAGDLKSQTKKKS